MELSMKSFIESASIVASDSDSDTWKVRLIQEGQGSSGYYSAELLESYGHAFDNTVSYLNHTDDVSKRNFTEIAGRVTGQTWVEKDKDGKVGVYANWRPDDDHRRKLEQYRDVLGLSIFITGDGRYDEARDTILVESFDVDDPFRSVDVVIAPGANGRLLTESLKKIYESREVTDSNGKPSVTSAREERKLEMEKDVEERFAALENLLNTLVAKEQAAKAEAAQAEADENAGRTAVEAYDAAVTAIDAADLPEKVVESLRKQAKEGVDVAPLIEQAVAIKEASEEAAQDRLSESGVRTLGSRKVESAVDLGKAFG